MNLIHSKKILNKFLTLLLLFTTISVYAGNEKLVKTFLILYGTTLNLTDGDEFILGKYDLLDIDRFRYDDIDYGGTTNTWQALRQVNPDIEIYLYQSGVEAASHQDASGAGYLNNISRYNDDRGHSDGDLNTDNSNLFLLDVNNNRVFNQGFSDSSNAEYYYLLDFGSQYYIDYWLEATNTDIKNQDWVADGVFADNCVALSGPQYQPAPVKYNTNLLWSGEMNNFTSAIAAGLQSTSQKLWCNKGETRRSDGYDAWISLDTMLSHPDVLLEEGAFVVKWGETNDAQFYSETEWKRQLDILTQINNSSVAFNSHTDLDVGETGTDNYGEALSFDDAFWYAVSSFLLGKADNSYFFFRGAGVYNRIWWFDEYDYIHLGEPVGDYNIDSSTGSNIYWREFVKGFVYVNPTGNDVSGINLPAPSKLLTSINFKNHPDSIPTVNSIDLDSHRGTIVLKDSIVAEWKLDELVGSTIASDNHGVLDGSLQGSPIWNPSIGIGGAISFDGVNDSIIVDQNTSQLDISEELTISAWVKPKPSQTSSPFVLDRGKFNQHGWQLLAGTGYNEFAFQVHSNGAHQLLHSAGIFLDDNEWHQIVVTVENEVGGNVKFYVDGELKKTRTLNFKFDSSASEPLYLGAYEPGENWASYWKGDLDEVKVYRRAISDDEVSKNYLLTKAYWKFDQESTSSIAYDSFNFMHGEFFGDPVWTAGSSLNFDGDDAVVIDHDSSQLDVSDKLTISAWVNPTSANHIFVMDRGVYEQHGWQLIAGTGYNDFALQVHRNGQRQLLNSDGIYLNDNQFHHIAVTIDNRAGGDVKFYVDGVLKKTRTLDWSFDSSSVEQLNIGAYEPGETWADYWQGALKKVSIFGRVLSDAEIANLD